MGMNHGSVTWLLIAVESWQKMVNHRGNHGDKMDGDNHVGG